MQAATLVLPRTESKYIYYLKHMPGVLIMAASVVSIVAAFFYKNPYMAIPPAFAFAAALYITYQYHVLQPLKEQLQRQLAESRAVVREQRIENDRLHLQLDAFDKKMQRLESNIDNMGNVGVGLKEQVVEFANQNAALGGFTVNIDGLMQRVDRLIGRVENHEQSIVDLFETEQALSRQTEALGRVEGALAQREEDLRKANVEYARLNGQHAENNRLHAANVERDRKADAYDALRGEYERLIQDRNQLADRIGHPRYVRQLG